MGDWKNQRNFSKQKLTISMQERDHYKSAKDIGNHEGTRSQHFRCSRQRKQIVQVNSIDIIVLNKFDDSIVEKSSMHSSLSLLVARGSWYQVQGSGFKLQVKAWKGQFLLFRYYKKLQVELSPISGEWCRKQKDQTTKSLGSFADSGLQGYL